MLIILYSKRTNLIMCVLAKFERFLKNPLYWYEVMKNLSLHLFYCCKKEVIKKKVYFKSKLSFKKINIMYIVVVSRK